MVNNGVPTTLIEVSLYAAHAGVHEIGPSINHRLSIHVGAPVRAACRCDGRSSHRLQRHGDIDIVPAGLPGVWEDEQACTLLRLQLMPALINAAADGLGLNRAIVELAPRFQLDDPQIRHIGWALKAELESGYPGGRLFVESLGMALATHLLRSYAVAPCRTLEPRLSKRELQRVTNYVESNLDRSLSLAELASVAGMGASHFKTLFKRSVGLPVHRYVVLRRVEHAKKLLVQGDVAMSDIALQSGFSHQSHMARWIRRTLGVAPAEVFRSGR